MPTILFLAADPVSATRLALDSEMRAIDRRLQASPERGAFSVEQAWAVRIDDLQACLLRHEPAIVHFSGQGSPAGQLLVEDGRGGVAPIDREALAALFAVLRGNIRCVVLSACFSLEQARAIARHIDCVIGLGASLEAEARIGFIPTELGCRLLFTTRRRDAGNHFTSAEVSVLPEEAARALLLSERSAAGKHELEAAAAICWRLGHLPLALALAGAFLGQHPEIGLGEYRDRLVEEGCLVALDEAGVEALDLATQHDAAVGATLRLQWEALKSEEARRVLQVAALLGEGAQVPRARLALLTGFRDRAAKGRPAPLGEALRAASQLWLIEELTAEEVRLHPLVREFVAGTIEGRAAFAQACAERMGEALWDMGRLHEEVAGRGVDAVLADVWLGAALAPVRRVERLLRVLNLEAHNLRLWKPAQEPGFFLQQLRNCCLDLGWRNVQALAEMVLEEVKWPWLREWTPTRRVSEALVRTLEGHTDVVSGVAVTADGRFAVSASDDKTLKVWDVGSGKLLRTLEGHTDVVSGVAVTADGRFAISASSDKILKVWDLGTGHALRTLEGHTDVVSGVAVTADGCFVVSASWDTALKVWDLGTGHALRTLAGHTSYVSGVAVTADDRFAVSAALDTTLKIWDLGTGHALRTLAGHTSYVYGVAVTADGRFAVSAALDKTLKAWDLATGHAVRTLEGHASDVYGVAVTTDGRFAVSAALDTTLKIWDLSSGHTLRTLEGHTDVVSGVAVTADGRFAVSASWDKTLKVWDLGTGQALRTLEGHTDVVSGVAVTADGRFAVSASWDKTLKVWDLGTGQALRTLKGHTSYVYGVAVTADGCFAVSASWDKTLKVWDLGMGQALRILQGHTSDVKGVAVTADGRFAVSASVDKTLKVWDLGTGQALRTLEGHTSLCSV